jgi:DNA repair protein RadC
MAGGRVSFARRGQRASLRVRRLKAAKIRPLELTVGGRNREVLVAVMLDAQHRVIATEVLFQGTLTQTSVYIPARS